MISRRANILSNALRTFKLVWNFDKKYLISVISIDFAIQLLLVVAAWYSAQFINQISTNKFETLLDPKLIFIVIIYVTIPLINSVLYQIKGYLQGKFFALFDTHISAILFPQKRAFIDLQTHESSGFASLLERVNQNTMSLYGNIDNALSIIRSVFIVTFAIISIGFFYWWLTIILILSIAPNLYLEVKYGKRKWGTWSMHAEDRKMFQEFKKAFLFFPSIIDLKIQSLSEYFANKIQNLIAPFNQSNIKVEYDRTKAKIYAKLLQHVVSGLIIIYLMNSVIEGGILIGYFIFILSRLNDLKDSTIDFFSNIGRMSSNNHFLNDIFEFLDTKKVIKNGKERLSEGTPKLEFKNVSFKYPETEKFILEDLNLIIEPGEKVAIVGVNGAGKTTFTKTLMRFYDVTTGEILIDGKNIKDVDINTFYEKLGYLPQDYARYRLTIAEAISISDPYRKSASKESKLDEIIEASKKAGSHEFIMGLEKGYDTQLGKEFEGGVEPSVGQWQKLALARLFYKNPEVWILDEPTASIDAVAEIEIFNELEKLPKDKTVILISHRFNTVKNADKIIVIEHGKIAEMGSHEELMNIPDGHYKNLFNSQKDSYN